MPDKKDRKIKNNDKKNKDEHGKDLWCTQDLSFDQEGCLYIANKELGRMIQQSMNAWGGQLCILRDLIDDDNDGNDDEGGVITDNKVNMMCPCGPQP